jgi:DNA-binding response OmpR family regulator
MAKIVLVDDDRAGCLFLSAALRPDGHKVLTAYDAMSGFALLIRERPDLLVLDLSMPAGGGFSIAERMSRIPALAGIPVIVITGTDDGANRDRAAELGAAAFLVKPIDGAELRTAVAEALGR